ncbi:MAG: hypothetical protein JWO47_563 [Candidatus Saccharibacteria bacterium]|nr:hypothetical protein [Candidatus Saccharibacteria bacterium]
MVQQLEDQAVAKKSWKLKMSWLAPVLLIVSVATTLVAILAITSWVELSGWHHALQHVMIFVSGTVAGGSLLSMHKKKEQ